MWTKTTKNIFAAFLPEEKMIATPAVDVAISLADHAQAHLTMRALSVKHVAPYSVMPGFIGPIVSKVNSDEKQALEKVSSHLDRMLKTVSFPHDVSIAQHPYDELVAMVGLQGRMHDLSVIDVPADYMTLRQPIFEELVFQTGRPVLIVPAGISTFSAKRIVIAWDGSACAVRALSDAMPFLADAGHVELTTIVNEKKLNNIVSGTDMARQLSRHGVNVEVVDIEMRDDAGMSLINRAERIGANLIVSGAFAHSRWRHLVLGGVTTSLLRKSTIPVFMSH